MLVELSGKLIQLLTPQSGMGKNGAWNKQDFIIETNDQYPRKICISAWNTKAQQITQIPMNTEVKVNVNIESREYNGRWYTDIRMWTIQVANSAVDVSPDYSTPFETTLTDSLSSDFSSSGGKEDDLPF